MQKDILEQQQSNQSSSQNSQLLLQKIYNLLNQTLHPDTQTIRNAQQNLYILSNTPQFINTLLSIPLIPGIQNNMSKLAITYSNTYIKNIQYSQKQAQLIKTMQLLVQFISLVQLDINIRKQACHVLINLLLDEKNKLLLLACQQQLKKLLQNAIMKISEGSWKQVNFQYMAMFVHAIISAIGRVENHVQFVERTFGNVVKLACFVNRIIQQQIINIGNSNTQYIQRIAAQSKILCLYLDSINKYLDIIHSINSNTTHIINTPDFSQLVQKTICINIPNNKYTLPIFYSIVNTTDSINKLLQQLLTIKYKSIILLTKSFPGLAGDYMLLGKNNIKRYELLENGDRIIEMLVKAGYQVFKERNWWQLNRIQIQTLIQIYNFLRIGIQTNLYYQTYTKLKAQIIYGIVMKSLMFSNNQYMSYYDDPDQFINSIYHILGDNQNNSKDNNINGSNNSNNSNGNNSKMQQPAIQSQNNQIRQNIQQQQIQIQIDNYNSFKSQCANLLVSFTSHIDGTLTQLVILCLTVLQSPTVQTTYKKDLMLLLLCILSKNIQNNNNLIVGIGHVLIIALRLRNIPKKKQQQTMQGQSQNNYNNYNNQDMKRNQNQLKISAQSGTEYILILLGFQRYLQMIDKLTQQVYQSLLVIIQQIMVDNNVQDTPKLISCSLLSKILATNNISFIGLKNLLYALLATLSLKQVHIKFISSLENIIQYSLNIIITKQTSSIYNNKNNNINNMLVQDKNNQQNIQIIIQIMNRIIQLIYIQVKKQANKEVRQNGLVYIGKLWNILRDIGEHIGNLGIVAQQMYKALSILIPLISDDNQQILQEHLYQLLCTMLKKYPNMNQIFLSLLTTISHKFHNSFTCRYSLSLTYSFLQHIIFYLAPILSTPSHTNTIKCLLQMCVTSIQQQTVYQLPRSQGQMYQGLILMQSILISLSKNIQGQVWISLLDVLYKKYKVGNIVYDFYKAGLVTNMMIIIVFACKYFQYGKVKELLSQLLKCHYYFTYKKSSKIFTIAVIQLFNLAQLPFFQQLFPQILQCSLIMLKSIQIGKQNILQSQQLDTQQNHYIKLKQQTINCLNNIDQFHIFKNQLQKLKLQNNQLVDKAYNFLSDNKRQYIKEIFRLKKVKDNIRVIYKIKHR